MGELIRDLIDVAALESGGLRLRPAPLDLAALAAESVAAHEPLAQRKEQSLTLAVTPPGPVFRHETAIANATPCKHVLRLITPALAVA